MTTGTATASKPKKKRAAARFKSKSEMREVLDRLLTAIDGDPVVGPSMRSAHVPHRFVYPDFDMVCNITGSEEDEHCLRWSFSDDIDWKPALTLEMSSEVANRYLQGQENLAIAIARGRIRAHGNARAALAFLPASRGLIGCYRSIVERSYPHLLLG